uniref:Phosphopantothenoylcysteine decarboxylase n=1 Tax=Crithidia acanthocephali TaxID=59798 RepID=T1YUP0_9TRYP|nr:phosphopantothenoylcysteine decarboxylase [Crithidia acanthocephali]
MTAAAPTSGPLPTEEEYPSVHLLLLVTGSVAAIKTGLLLDQLSTERCNIRIAATKAAFHFLRRAQPSKTGIPFQSIITDEQEWSEWQAMNDSIVHIELRRWADIVVIAPLNANTLAKVATGICDNLVSSVMRAWEVRAKPVIVCPAMNSAMWTHPLTATQLSQLETIYMDPQTCAARKAVAAEAEQPATTEPATRQQESATTNTTAAVPAGADAATPICEAAHLPPTLAESMFQIVGPVSKRLACGDIGIGGMASVEEIAAHIRHTMELIREDKRRQFREARAKVPVADPAIVVAVASPVKPPSAEPEKTSPAADTPASAKAE